MSRFLIADIGAGTMDVLYFDDESNVHYKAVARSPVLHVAEKASRLPGKLLVTGGEMGGGPVTQVLKERARGTGVVMTRSSARTLHHDLDRVLSWGIRVIEDDEAERFLSDPGFSRLVLADLDVDRLRQIVEGLGVPFEFDVVGVCAQDHGMPPSGMSHLDYRHNLFKSVLDRNPHPEALLFEKAEVPETFNRLRALGESGAGLPANEVYVMDSGMAAILGASLDSRAASRSRIMVLDIATSHTVGAALEAGELAGFFEYHTHDITLDRLESLLEELADGRLDHQGILEEGGHGAYIRKAPGFDAIEIILATGPKRRLLTSSRLPMTMGSPLGDNMMTGAAGVLEAIRRRKGLPPVSYL